VDVSLEIISNTSNVPRVVENQYFIPLIHQWGTQQNGHHVTGSINVVGGVNWRHCHEYKNWILIRWCWWI